MKHRIAIFASGSGTNAEEIFRYFQNHDTIEVGALLSNNTNAFALKRADNYRVPTFVFTGKQFRETDVVLNWLQVMNITHIVLAGFMLLVPKSLLSAYSDRIINIHPALLPKFGGKGMYGMHVHNAVKEAGIRETGITIHLVNEHYDEGKILLQERCPVNPDDTPESIAEKVHQLEYAHYPRAIEKWILS